MESSLNILHQPDLSWEDKIAYLAWKMSQDGGHRPEDFPVRHMFLPGRYLREFFLPAGIVFLGRKHREGHIVLLCEGTAKLITEKGFTLHTGPDAVLTPPGYQTVSHILTPCRVRTIHPNPENERDWELLEDRFFESAQPTLLRGQAVQERLFGQLEVQS